MGIETENELHVFCNDDNCSAMIRSKVDSVAVAEMNTLGNPLTWWVARVLVRKPENRGKGYGSRVLQAALKAVMEKTGGMGRVTVAPGGYDNDDRKFSFYVKNGFKRVTDDGLYEWRQPRGADQPC
jgi:predicted GNAT family N-acyltransferase